MKNKFLRNRNSNTVKKECPVPSLSVASLRTPRGSPRALVGAIAGLSTRSPHPQNSPTRRCLYSNIYLLVVHCIVPSFVWLVFRTRKLSICFFLLETEKANLVYTFFGGQKRTRNNAFSFSKKMF